MNQPGRLAAVCVIVLSAAALLLAGQATAPAPRLSMTYAGGSGPGQGRHVVWLTGDEEYRSEEALPMLAKILSQRHGFRSTVLFPLDADGTINPKNTRSLADSAALDRADLIVMMLRFRQWPDEDMARFERALHRGVPIVAIRTSTHPFNGFPAGSPWAKWNYNNQGGFGRQVVGETWVTHWGRHKVEATRGAIEPARASHPVLRGVSNLFGETDVYEAYPPADATVLVRGVVLQTLDPASPPAAHTKVRARDKQRQLVNDPAMPVVWTREHRNEAGTTNRVLASTMGAATDFENEGLRRLIVNGVFWGLGMDVPARADVTYVDPYRPSFYGFDGFRQGLRVADFALGATVPGEPLPRPE
jgi:type 1 glutamine amidotransferase